MHPNVLIRPIRPGDAPLLAAAHASLSPETVRLRYLAPKPRLTAGELRYLTEVDGIDHVAFIALRGGYAVYIASFGIALAVAMLILDCRAVWGRPPGLRLAPRPTLVTRAGRFRTVHQGWPGAPTPHTGFSCCSAS